MSFTFSYYNLTIIAYTYINKAEVQKMSIILNTETNL